MTNFQIHQTPESDMGQQLITIPSCIKSSKHVLIHTLV